jgi:hypothetical protein
MLQNILHYAVESSGIMECQVTIFSLTLIYESKRRENFKETAWMVRWLSNFYT